MLPKSAVREYDRIYSKSSNAWESPERDDLAGRIIAEHCQPSKILDVGCGNGHTLDRLSKVFPDAELHGLDISTVAIEIASKRVPSAHFHRCFVQEFKPGWVADVVTAMGTAEHFQDLSQGLCSLILLGKYCYLEVPHNLRYSPGSHSYRRLSIGSQQYEWHLTRQEWEAQINAAGWEIAKRYSGASAVYEFIWMLKHG